jgi:hypothetical protein
MALNAFKFLMARRHQRRATFGDLLLVRYGTSRNDAV